RCRLQKTLTKEQINAYYELVAYIIDQLEFPLWAQRFKQSGLDRYFFQTIGIVITPHKETILTAMRIQQAKITPIIVALKLRGLETLISESLNSISRKQIRELNTLLKGIIESEQKTT